MNQAEKLPPIEVDDDGNLHCPVCGDEWMHQREVEVGWRPEDGDVARYISNRNGVQTDTVPAADVAYGYRRQYTVVRLWCESCGDGFELQMRQHKGATILTWVKVGDPKARVQQPNDPPGWY